MRVHAKSFMLDQRRKGYKQMIRDLKELCPEGILTPLEYAVLYTLKYHAPQAIKPLDLELQGHDLETLHRLKALRVIDTNYNSTKFKLTTLGLSMLMRVDAEVWADREIYGSDRAAHVQAMSRVKLPATVWNIESLKTLKVEHLIILEAIWLDPERWRSDYEKAPYLVFESYHNLLNLSLVYSLSHTKPLSPEAEVFLKKVLSLLHSDERDLSRLQESRLEEVLDQVVDAILKKY